MNRPVVPAAQSAAANMTERVSTTAMKQDKKMINKENALPLLHTNDKTTITDPTKSSDDNNVPSKPQKIMKHAKKNPHEFVKKTPINDQVRKLANNPPPFTRSLTAPATRTSRPPAREGRRVTAGDKGGTRQPRRKTRRVKSLDSTFAGDDDDLAAHGHGLSQTSTAAIISAATLQQWHQDVVTSVKKIWGGIRQLDSSYHQHSAASSTKNNCPFHSSQSKCPFHTQAPRYSFTTADILSICNDDEAWHTLQQSLRQRRCVTNAYLQQNFHFYVHHVRQIRGNRQHIKIPKSSDNDHGPSSSLEHQWNIDARRKSHLHHDSYGYHRVASTSNKKKGKRRHRHRHHKQHQHDENDTTNHELNSKKDLISQKDATSGNEDGSSIVSNGNLPTDPAGIRTSIPSPQDQQYRRLHLSPPLPPHRKHPISPGYYDSDYNLHDQGHETKTMEEAKTKDDNHLQPQQQHPHTSRYVYSYNIHDHGDRETTNLEESKTNQHSWDDNDDLEGEEKLVNFQMWLSTLVS